MNESYDSLDPEQFRRLEEASREGDFKDKLVVILSGYLGLRVQEIRHLRAGWIDFQRQEINIPEEDRGWPPEDVKARSRTLPYGNFRKKVKTDIEHYFRDHEILDVSKATIYNRLERLAKNADIRTKVTPKKLRYKAIGRWIEEDKNIMKVQELAGYERLEPVQKFV